MKDLQVKSTVPGAELLNKNQRMAKPVRAQRPADNTDGGQPHWPVGTMPVGGFRSVFNFDDNQTSTKLSPTTKPGRKVY